MRFSLGSNLRRTHSTKFFNSCIASSKNFGKITLFHDGANYNLEESWRCCTLWRWFGWRVFMGIRLFLHWMTKENISEQQRLNGANETRWSEHKWNFKSSIEVWNLKKYANLRHNYANAKTGRSNFASNSMLKICISDTCFGYVRKKLCNGKSHTKVEHWKTLKKQNGVFQMQPRNYKTCFLVLQKKIVFQSFKILVFSQLKWFLTGSVWFLNI